MLRIVHRAITPLLLLALNAGLAAAQEPAPTAEDLTLRPGDTVMWNPSGPHLLRFGGTVNVGGESITLTPFADVVQLLEHFDPPLTVAANGIAMAPRGTPVSATVRDDAPSQEVTQFFFTCGFRPHVNRMVTIPFTIAPIVEGRAPRDIQIATANGPFRWVLRIGDRTLNLARP